jgi:hypothetical protein
MAKSQKIIPVSGMDLSIDESYMADSVARFIKGWYLFVNNNQTSENDGGFENGSNAYVFTPNQSNEIFATQSMASGVNKCIGGGYVVETNKYYSCIWNSNGNHSIWQLDGVNRSVTKVIESSCFDFQYDAKHFISQTRFTYATYDYFDKNSNVKKTKTWIFITDDNSRTKQINVEDAIATNGFTTPSSFFNETDCCDICTMITMGSPAKPIGCIDITPVPRPDTIEEKSKQNVINFRVWQFRLKAIDVWGRESVHGVISKQYYNSPSTSCIQDESKYPRLIDLSFDAGCKWIASYQIEYRNCGVGNSDELQSDWKAYEIVDKYSDCNSSGIYQQNFWNRAIYQKYYQTLTEENHINYDPVTNKFTVRFSGDKEVKLIPNSETNINQNYIPNKSNSLFRLGNKIGVANNERGFNPLLCNQKDAIKFNPIDEESYCNPLKYIKIEIWGYIYSPLESLTTNIRYVEDAAGEKVAGYGFAGGSNGSMTSAQNNVYIYGQIFDRNINGAKQANDGKVEGFVMYAVGHEDIYCVSKQYDISDINNPIFKGVMSQRNNSKDYIQKWEFIVPQGKYIFRIGDPTVGLKKDILDKHLFRYKSANMIGLTSLSNIGSLLNNEQNYEIQIDACSSDINLIQTPVMIYDVTKKNTSGTTNLSNFISGYFINSNGVLENELGIESAIVTDIVSTTNAFYSKKTNANGYFFGFCLGNQPGISTQLKFNLSIDTCPTVSKDTVESNSSSVVNGFGEYRVDAEIFEIKGVVVESASNAKIENKIVVYQNGRFAITNYLGEFSIKAHGLNRTDKLVVANGINGCTHVSLNNICTTCFDEIIVVVPLCNTSRIVDIGIYQVGKLVIGSAQTILQGRYALGIVLEDCLGMETFVQANESNYVDISDTNKINRISYDLNGLGGLSNFKWLSFYITENLTYEDWMEWVADYFVLEDNNGYISGTTTPINSPKRMRIYINSLVSYTAYSQSNTSWQFIKGDLIQFFEMGDGDKINITKIVNYRQGENYVTIEYDDSMKNIIDNQVGVKLRLLRPRTINQNELYYQLCQYIKIENGIPTSLSGTLEFSNVYKVQRSIPIYNNVLATNQDVLVNIYDTQGNVIGTKIAKTNTSTPTPKDDKRIYALNHHSPSDFFGAKCWGKGRVNTKNPYEKKHRLATEISLSQGIGSEGLTNYLHWFTTLNSTSFDEQVYHSITGIVTGQNIVLAICTNDYFTLVYDQNEIRVDNKSGSMYATSALNKFGKPRTKVGDDFGCSQNDINTISYRNGAVFYLDSQRGAIVRHNFDKAEDFTPNGLSDWLQEKIQHNALYNKNIQNLPNVNRYSKYKQFIGIICPKRNEYILTSFKLNSDDSEYINNLREVSLVDNETVAIDINEPKRKFNYMYHFTPEMYGYLLSDEMGIQLVSFKNAIAHIHYPLQNGNANDYLKYYGTQCKRVMEIICNLENINDKNFLYIETMLKQHQLYIDRIETESNQESRLMPMWWRRTNNSWMADFKCQTNGIADPNLPSNSNQNSILDGTTLFGKWIKIRLITKDIDDNKYCELNSIEVFFDKLGK